jgi:hypothetical protein
MASQLLRQLAEYRRLQKNGEWTANAGARAARPRSDGGKECALFARELVLGRNGDAGRRHLVYGLLFRHSASSWLHRL